MATSHAVDLSTTYLGIALPHPLMPGASPLVDDLDAVRQLEDAGAAAIVMHSLFEEQIEDEQLADHRPRNPGGAPAGAGLGAFALGPEEYLEQIHRIKEAVEVPVIASLNGTTEGGWLEHAAIIEEAGADALELNVYQLVTDPWENADVIEDRTVAMVRSVSARLRIPVAVKLSPYYTSLASFAQQLDDSGADGLVLFNRFYQADVDVERREATPWLQLSDSSELLLRLRWLAILSGELGASLAASGGVHEPVDAVKAVMCGAHAVQVVSALFRRGPGYLETLREGLASWMEKHGYESLAALRGVMSLERCPDPHAFERGSYIRNLQSWWRAQK